MGEVEDGRYGTNAENAAEFAVSAVKKRAAVCRVTATGQKITVRLSSFDLWKIVPGEVISVPPKKARAFKKHRYLSGTLLNRRVDVTALDLVPLNLEYQGDWDPAELVTAEISDPSIADTYGYLKPLIAAGKKASFEMEQVVPGLSYEDYYDPIHEGETTMMKQLPDGEFSSRVTRIQAALEENGYDAYLVHCNEADQANVRYLSDHWPIFETAGVIVPKSGEAMLLIGPEAEPFAADRSRIRKIRKMVEYRESAEPDYPDIPVSTFPQVFDEISGGKGVKTLALGDYTILPMPVYDGVKKALGDEGTIVRAEWIISGMRQVKSDPEIRMIREAHRISELALDDILDRMKPGMTEKQALGVVYDALYRHGAEAEGFPNYVFGGKKTRNAIARATYDPIKKGELIQLCIGARYGGYAASVGRPVIFGKMPAGMKAHVRFGLDAHRKTYEWIKEGVVAKEVADKYVEYFKEHGYGRQYLYGPCHGCGIIEVEKPWMETSSGYQLKENMTFMADTFFGGEEYGFRWEDGFRVTRDGVEEFSKAWQKVIEL